MPHIALAFSAGMDHIANMSNSTRRTIRKPVVMSDDEFAALKAAADRRGLGISTFLRQAGLEAARKDDTHKMTAARVTASPDDETN